MLQYCWKNNFHVCRFSMPAMDLESTLTEWVALCLHIDTSIVSDGEFSSPGSWTIVSVYGLVYIKRYISCYRKNKKGFFLGTGGNGWIKDNIAYEELFYVQLLNLISVSYCMSSLLYMWVIYYIKCWRIEWTFTKLDYYIPFLSHGS